jgi:hypothetical protein
MPGNPDPLTSSPAPASSPRSLRLLAAGAVATVVVGFVVGFALGGRSGGDDVTAAGPGPSSTTTTTSSTAPDRSTTTEAPSSSTTARPTSTTTSSTTTVTVVDTTEAPPTSVVPFPTIATTVAPPTTVAVVPSRVVVSHGADPAGRLVIPRLGSATLVITNQGGLAQQWLVTGTGFTTAGPTQGSLGPGQTVTVTVLPPPGELPSSELTGIISVLGAVNPSVAFVIPPA